VIARLWNRPSGERTPAEDAATFDKIFDQAMADALSEGVIRQFASRF
jgi:hypothetical protein